MLSKALVVGAYQRKAEALVQQDPTLELTVAVPPGWRDERGWLPLERAHQQGYSLVVEPILFNGSYHLHYYPRLGRLMDRVRPHLVHLDEEPYNFATWHAQRLAARRGARTVFFSWQNLLRRYPWPFSAFERDVLRQAHAAIVGSREAEAVWRAKGFTGPIVVIPQFGVDPERFQPTLQRPARSGDAFVVGYAGRLVPEKGVDVLLRAVAQLPAAVRVRVAGSGPERGRLLRLAAELGLAERLSLEGQHASTSMPAFYAGLDCLALPSRTRPNWKEQFGRVLVEAMACGVPVVGSTCGEIPNVIGEAGLVFEEGDAAALARCLRVLWEQPERRAALARAGRERVLAHYTHGRVAADTLALYRASVNGQPNRL